MVVYTAIYKQVTWTRDRRPDSALMADEQYTMKILAGDNCQMMLQTNKSHQNDIHYIGIFADMAVSEITKLIIN